MLLELKVENLLLIEEATLRFGAGLNAITGETGAGKTMLAHALDLIGGGKPRQGIVRPGCEEANVSATFQVPEGTYGDPDLAFLSDIGVDESEDLVLARRVSAQGRSRATVFGRPATAADLRAIVGRLLRFHGQHEHRQLVRASSQLDALDAFCGGQHAERLRLYAREYERRRELAKRAAELEELSERRDRDLELIEYELDEIERLDPSATKKTELETERDRLGNVEALRAAAAAARAALISDSAEGPSVTALLAPADQELGRVAGVDGRLDSAAERLRSVHFEAEDVARELASYESGLEADPGRLEDVESQLETYAHLERKHGGTVDAVIAHAERCRAEAIRLRDATVELGEVASDLEAAAEAVSDLAEGITAAREEAAPRLSRRVEAELGELGMEAARFDVRVVGRAGGDPYGPSGTDAVEFMIAPNPGVPPAPLRETASGGELSRTMLALLTVAASGSEAETVIFDEVDAGIGGTTARAVGEKLRGLAGGEIRQVLCITHLPQIAALAHVHFRIRKEAPEAAAAAAAAVARTTVDRLEGGGIVEELCRMLGADKSDSSARRHAEELLAAA